MPHSNHVGGDLSAKKTKTIFSFADESSFTTEVINYSNMKHENKLIEALTL